MKSLQEYITESEQWIDSPAPGDDFAINIREDVLLETYILEADDDRIVLASDDELVTVLEEYGMLDELEGVAEAGVTWHGTQSGREEAAMTDHTVYDAKQYLKANYPVVKTYNVRRAEPGFRILKQPDELRKSAAHIVGVDGAVDYLQLEKNAMMSGSSQWSASIGSSWSVYENTSNGIAILYYQDRGMGSDSITVAGKTPKIQAQARQVFIDAGVLPEPKPRAGRSVDKPGVAEGSQDNMDDTQSPDQHLSRIRELAGMAEASPDWRSKMGFDMDDPSGDPLDDPKDRGLHRPETFVTSQGNKYTYILGGDLYDPSPTGDEMSAQIRFKGIDHVHPIQRIHLQYDPNMQAFDPEESRADDPILDIWLKQQRPFGNDEDSLDDFVDRAVAHVLRPPGLSEAEYRGRKVPLGKPMRGDVKKRKVYVRKPNGNVVKVEFGDKTMRIKKSNPKRRKSFRARHNCANPGPRWKARYWSCRAW